MSDYLLKEAIRYAIEDSPILINHIEGDSIKRILKDIDFYYNGKKYYLTIEIINSGKCKEAYFHEYINKDGISVNTYKSIKEIIQIESEEINHIINLMFNLSDFSKSEIKLAEAIKVEFLKNKRRL